MELAALSSVEGGNIELLQFAWPPEGQGVDSFSCHAYVVMKRRDGFLLCIPDGFMPQEDLEQGQQATEHEGIGPSLLVSAPPICLSETGDWVSPTNSETVLAVVLDLSASMAEQLGRPDIQTEHMFPFRDGEPNVFPLASEVLRLSKEWLAEEGALPAERSGYTTAISGGEPPLVTQRSKAPKPKRPTVQQLASQQEAILRLMTTLADRMDTMEAGHQRPPVQRMPAQVEPGAPLLAALRQPLSSQLPPCQARPKSLAAALGPPPPVRAQARASPVQTDLDAEAAKCIGDGELPGEPPDTLATAVLAQSQALVALVGQLQGASDPLLEGPPGLTASVRGAAGRAKLQQELAARTGQFAAKVRENLRRKMDPTGLLAPDQVSFMRFLERHGGFAGQMSLGLVAWQIAQAQNLLEANNVDGARDTLSLLFLMLDQSSLDKGDTTLGWLLTLQGEPPPGLFQTPTNLPGSSLQSFSALAEQRWVTIALAYMKELETIQSRRASVPSSIPAPRVPKPPHSPTAPESGEAALSRKQQRAAQWAAKKGRASSPGSKPISPPLSSVHTQPAVPLPDLGDEFTFCSWVSSLPRLLRGGRTSFAHFILSTLTLARDTTLEPATALFPLPLPFPGLFQQRARKMSKDEFRRLCVRRCTHFVIMSLNFLHAGCKHVPLDALRRPPSPVQAQAYGRIGALVRACSRQAETISAFAGRRGSRTAARLEEAVAYLRNAGFGPGSYATDAAQAAVLRSFPGTDAPTPTFDQEDKGELVKEAFLRGPSRFLPTGPQLCMVHVPAFHSCLVGSVTDRKDFYSQARVTAERGLSNAIGPAVHLSDLAGTAAYDAFLLKEASQKRRKRRLKGDGLEGDSPRSILVGPPSSVHGTFLALLQGDAGGVEYATAGHEGLLQTFGLLDSEWGRSGLSASEAKLRVAKAAYASEQLPGADDKDIWGKRHFKVAGAEIDSSVECVRDGLTTIGCPAKKRLSLAALSIRAACWPLLSSELCSMLAGSWVSCLLYRRCLMSCLDGLFALGKSMPDAPAGSAAVLLPRKVAGELQLLALLAPVMCTNASASPADFICSTDASTAKGAYCRKAVDPEASLHCWLASDLKGRHIRLTHPGATSEVVHEALDFAASSNSLCQPESQRIKKPLACTYDFLQICGSGSVTQHIRSRGLCSGPVIDLSRSKQYDLSQIHVVEWVCFLLQDGRLKSVLLEPPCATFRKELALLGNLIDISFIRRKCPGQHQHVRIQGGLEKATAVPQDKFAAAVAKTFAKAIFSRPTPAEAPKTGLENVAINDLLVGGSWFLGRSWVWRRSAHINVLETQAALEAIKDAVVQDGGDLKLNLLLDSAVARGALAKGRSSSHLLRPVLCRAAAWQVAGGIYAGYHHAPTRLNTADDPTRDRTVREAAGLSLVAVASDMFLPSLLELAKLSAPVGAWFRLALLLSFKEGPRPPRREFDSSLGYPGEGPLSPRNQQDRQRQGSRAGRSLPEGRPVLLRTSNNRDKLLHGFDAWLRVIGSSLQFLLTTEASPAETIVGYLCRYGRELFDAGRPYWHYAETINAIAAKRPSLRRQLQGAWDLAFQWMSLEPHTHHVAMPAVILLSMLSLSLLWGWRLEAGIFALAWGGLLRIGEATGSLRASLVLPRDVLFANPYVLLRIVEPKTRFRAARHQAAKVDQEDLVKCIDMAFASLPASSRLWPMSSQTLRRRFDSILDRLGVPTARNHARPLDLGSFRPGGATHQLQVSEDAELVRRRGRWMSHRVMEVYLQEVMSSVFYPSLPIHVRENVMEAAVSFPAILEQSVQWTRQKIPTEVWYSLWCC
ncbi:unnamed protein product [Symbiodinium natans]|uniref:Uncharacterized protein n=1 Tax=Symbiodinium natans TaxID=878477 RepID=A0A812PAI3_9DINO|nr:unnamed protein product [Symbiodinium natans]